MQLTSSYMKRILKSEILMILFTLLAITSTVAVASLSLYLFVTSKGGLGPAAVLFLIPMVARKIVRNFYKDALIFFEGWDHLL